MSSVDVVGGPIKDLSPIIRIDIITLCIFGFMWVCIYFFFIRPQTKDYKALVKGLEPYHSQLISYFNDHFFYINKLFTLKEILLTTKSFIDTLEVNQKLKDDLQFHVEEICKKVNQDIKRKPKGYFKIDFS